MKQGKDFPDRVVKGMAGKRRTSEFEILKTMQEMQTPMGALQLSDRLEIPPASIGRALLKLEKKGLVEKVQNKGRVITAAGEAFLEEQKQRQQKMEAAHELIEAAASVTEANLNDILLVRRLLERYTARACTERITPEELEALEDIQFDYIYEVKHGRNGSEEDLSFHLKIAEIAGSPTITRLLRLLLTDQDAYAAFTQAAVQTERLKYNEHEAILDAIRAGDGARAGEEMEKHLGRVGDNVHNYLK